MSNSNDMKHRARKKIRKLRQDILHQKDILHNRKQQAKRKGKGK